MCDLCDESSGCLREVVTRREKGGDFGGIGLMRGGGGEGMDSRGLDLLFNAKHLRFCPRCQFWMCTTAKGAI